MRVLRIAALAFLAIAALPGANEIQAQPCVKFDGLTAGTVWGSSAGDSPGDQVHVENGIRVTVHGFAWTTGGTFGDATVDTSWFTSSPNSVNTNNINLGFDFTGLASVPTQVAVKFRDLGGFENLSLNGSPLSVGELASGSGGGLSWTVADFPVAGGRAGKLTVNGNLHTLVVGGQEFWLDTLCVTAKGGGGGLDHFKVYQVEGDVTFEKPVDLRDQWDREEPDKVLVNHITHFANPVSKRGEPIHHENAHLTFYRIAQEKPEPNRIVTVDNQFGRQQIKVGAPIFLLVPTEKREKGSSFPKHLDHFKCYEAKGKAVEEKVRLRDQFVEDHAALGVPRLFCLPVEKTHEKKVFEIQHPDDHLLFYVLEPEGFEKVIETYDQFGDHKLQVIQRELLGVPTKKLFTENQG